ncbi:MAG TPA: FAD-dependent monooxygenase, partial [Thermoleophilaceae bacterium]
IHSPIRRELIGDGEARPLDAVAWRCMSTPPPGVDVLDEARQVWGRGGEFGWVPLSDGRVYWFAAERLRPEAEHPGGRIGELVERFGGWTPEIEPLIAAADEERILRTELLARTAPRSWSRGPVALLGDSAHAMAPNLGQGACQALEDAVVLGRVLTGAEDPVRALREYSRARVPRAKAVSAISEWTGSMLYVNNGLLWRLRDLAFAAAPATALRMQLDTVMRSRALLR